MPVELAQIRSLLLPGLYERYSYAFHDWRGVYGTYEAVQSIKAPAIIGLKTALIVGAAAKIIENPVVTRRFWLGWMPRQP